MKAISPKSPRAAAAQTDAVLTVRATAWPRRQTLVGSHELGWNDASTWEAGLVERGAAPPFKRTGSAVTDSENLNPAPCGNYSGRSRALAQHVFEPMRRDGIVARGVPTTAAFLALFSA